MKKIYSLLTIIAGLLYILTNSSCQKEFSCEDCVIRDIIPPRDTTIINDTAKIDSTLNVTGVIILVVVLLHYYTKINHILLFWIAFIFTRPFGATFGDFLTKPLSKGGLELGTLPSSLVSIAIMTILVIISHRQHTKQTTI
ncbi:MAG: hypothetical protein M0Q26_08540 [Chitinophagaceae bacterium]|nr:hypothetical protein [Chitinophagaceae bacterium]MDP1811067.1 hypothetical protein [Sediminibacterium sp.]MDP3128263.1 hypothetical protein [Sediminibacterium sp.]